MNIQANFTSRVLPLLRAGKPAVGSWINTASPVVGEVMAQAGFDFLTVDCEHSAVDLGNVQQIFQGIRSGSRDCDCFVRLHGIDYALVKRYLDAGANGVIAPLVENREQVELLLSAVKYPPEGRRGVGFCRANKYGVALGDYLEKANGEILVAVQIESDDGVKNIESILNGGGIDAVFIGPYDLSASLGIPGDFTHPDFVKAKAEVLAACREKEVAAGIHVVGPNPAEFVTRVAEGYQLLAYSLDITMLAEACRSGLAEIQVRMESQNKAL